MPPDPYINLRAECALLGGMLIAPEHIDPYSDVLTPEDFSEPAYQEWWRGLRHSLHDGSPGDLAVMHAFFAGRGTLDLVARHPDAELMGACTNAFETPRYVELVVNAAIERDKQNILTRMAQRVLDPHQGMTQLEALDARRASLAGDAAQPVSAPSDGRFHPTFQRASDLMREELPPIRWIVRDIFPEGLTLLAAKAKKGKSTLMVHIALSVALGANALGTLRTEKGDVLYLALEDNKRRMQRRMHKMLCGGAAPDGLTITYRWLPLNRGGAEDLERYLDANPDTHLVIVDTLHHVRAASIGRGNAYADDYEACRELLRIAGERRIAIVVITHLRKAPADDPFDEINATMGLMAGVDNALVMRPAGRDGLMELYRSGRDYEDDTTLALQGDKETLLWRFAGQAADAKRSAERTAILKVLRDAQEKGMTPKEMLLALGWTQRNNLDVLLTKLLEEHPAPIARPQRGRYLHSDFLTAYEASLKSGGKMSQRESPHEFRDGVHNDGDLTDLTHLNGNCDAQRAGQVVKPLPFSAMLAKHGEMRSSIERESGNQGDSPPAGDLIGKPSSMTQPPVNALVSDAMVQDWGR